MRERVEAPLVVISHSSAGVIGLKVAEVRRSVTVTSGKLLPPPAIIRGIRGELLIAVIPYGEEIYLLMDIENVLTGDEKVALFTADLSAPTAVSKSEG